MANKEHLRILKQGIQVWNRWREESPDVRPDLSGADLRSADLSGADLRNADLSKADLSGTDLSQVNLTKAKVTNANLRRAILNGTILFNTDLTDADLSEAKVGFTVFANNDLSTVKGLESVHHFEFSSIGIDTIYRSKGKIPEKFLQAAGVPDTFIAYIDALTGKDIQYYSCFISYSSKDEAFAKRLYADLQAIGIRCWFAPEDIRVGDKISQVIDQSIRLHDKLLLVLSGNTVASDWVRKEVKVALKKEREEGRTVLYPIRLDHAVIETDQPWAADIRRSRHIGDFSQWKDHDYYQKALSRLARDLTVSVATEADSQERAR